MNTTLKEMKNDNPNTQTSASQTARIKAALLRGEKLTPMDALRRFGCFRLGATETLRLLPPRSEDMGTAERARHGHQD